MEAKQVIVMRTDLNMRKGKMIAQGAHASIAFLTQHGQGMTVGSRGNGVMSLTLSAAGVAWVTGAFVKICVRVDSEAALMEIVAQAKATDVVCSLIQDAGRTEFGGVPTYTCCAIGPDWADRVDLVTGGLSLL